MKRKRTNHTRRFLADNRRLLLFLLLAVFGCVLGMVLYAVIQPSVWSKLLVLERVPRGFSGAFSQLFESCFQPVLLLTVLFISGLSACGAPSAVVVPIFWGVGLGLVQTHYYADGWSGLLVIAAVLLPHSVMEAVALLMASSEALRMSVRLTGLLLPRSAHCGGLWQEFRLYCVRFLLLLLLLFGAGALDVVMRLLFAGWL